MAATSVEQARQRGMVESLQMQDPQISSLVAYCKFGVVYYLVLEGSGPSWQKADIEGPVYVVRRRSAPWYQLIVKNQFSTTDLMDYVSPSWELDCQKNYFFYKVEDLGKPIRGLWFHDDSERLKLEDIVGKILEDLRRNPNAEPPPEAGEATRPTTQSNMVPQAKAAQATRAQAPRGPASVSVNVTLESLRATFHQLADDPNFLSMLMQKLKEMQEQGGRSNGAITTG